MREILTLQVGKAGNFAATHFWNILEAYPDDGQLDFDVFYQPHDDKSSRGGITYTPRTLIFDVKSNIGPIFRVEQSELKIDELNWYVWQCDYKMFV